AGGELPAVLADAVAVSRAHHVVPAEVAVRLVDPPVAGAGGVVHPELAALSNVRDLRDRLGDGQPVLVETLDELTGRGDVVGEEGVDGGGTDRGRAVGGGQPLAVHAR